jgi:hypothetical protein
VSGVPEKSRLGSGLGALTSWTLVTAELSYGAARDGVLPTAVIRTRRDVP